MTTDVIEKEFNKHPTLMALLKSWHQESFIDKKELYHFKALYKGNLDYIKNFKMSINQFNSFNEFYTSLQKINTKTRKIFNHPFFYLKGDVFEDYLKENDISFFKAENGNITAIVDSFEKSQILSPVTWCISDRENMYASYTKGSGKVFITFDQKNNMITGTSISHVLISFNQFNEQTETPKEVIPVIKPLVYKNYVKSLLKGPLIAGSVLSIFIFLLFSEVLLGEHPLNFNAQNIALSFLTTIFITIGFSFLVTPPNISIKTREFFVFFGFILTVSSMAMAIVFHINSAKNEYITELNDIYKNTAHVSFYEDWNLENGIYYKNVPEFLAYGNETITCNHDLLTMDNTLSGVNEKRKYCYFKD